MSITQPSRLTFWRLVFGLTALVPFLASLQLIMLAPSLGVDISASRSWMQLLLGLGLIGILPLLLLTLTWSRYRERLLTLAEFPERFSVATRW
ncbi:MAG TPA: hypothetical protein VJM08_11580, partial [Anaerolineales bacterium]|nr:hypothetical protein [Anaerolineales bacterium]